MSAEAQAVVNTVLLVLILPILFWLTKSINTARSSFTEANDKTNKTLEENSRATAQAIGEVSAAFREVKTILMGLENQGGLFRRVDELANRMHRAEQALTTLLIDKELSLENFHLRKTS